MRQWSILPYLMVFVYLILILYFTSKSYRYTWQIPHYSVLFFNVMKIYHCVVSSHSIFLSSVTINGSTVSPLRFSPSLPASIHRSWQPLCIIITQQVLLYTCIFPFVIRSPRDSFLRLLHATGDWILSRHLVQLTRFWQKGVEVRWSAWVLSRRGASWSEPGWWRDWEQLSRGASDSRRPGLLLSACCKPWFSFPEEE